jgi:hypothetical protein
VEQAAETVAALEVLASTVITLAGPAGDRKLAEP